MSTASRSSTAALRSNSCRILARMAEAGKLTAYSYKQTNKVLVSGIPFVRPDRAEALTWMISGADSPKPSIKRVVSSTRHSSHPNWMHGCLPDLYQDL